MKKFDLSLEAFLRVKMRAHLLLGRNNFKTSGDFGLKGKMEQKIHIHFHLFEKLLIFDGDKRVCEGKKRRGE